MTEEMLAGIFAGSILLWVIGIVIVLGADAWRVISETRKRRKSER